MISLKFQITDARSIYGSTADESGAGLETELESFSGDQSWVGVGVAENVSTQQPSVYALKVPKNTIHVNI